MERGGKAGEAAILLEAYFNTKADRVRAEYVKLLDNLWPGVRCRYDEQVLKVYYASTQMRGAPSVLFEAASYVEEVLPNEAALVRKDDKEGVRRIPTATYPLHALLAETLPRPAPSFWHRLVEEDLI